MNRLIYLTLLLLTVIAFTVASHPSLLMGLVGTKFLLVGFFFMDLRRAHAAWRIGFAGFVVLYLILFLVLL